MDERAYIAQIISSKLLPAGFTTRRSAWEKKSGELLIRLFVRRDRWRPHQWYIDFEASVLELNTDGKTEWHLAGRRFDRSIADKLLIEKALDFGNNEMGIAERTCAVEDFLDRVALPFLSAIETIEGLRKLHEGELLACFMHRRLSDLLSKRREARGAACKSDL